MSFISGVPHRPFLFLSIGNIFQMFSEVMPTIESPKTNPAYFKLEDYNIDYATGFFPQEPLPRLMGPFAIWEDALDGAEGKLSLGEDTRESAKARRPYGEAWRERVRKFPMLDTDHLVGNIRLLQRAHMVLAFLINFYAHSQPPSETPAPVHIPPSMAVPMVNISRELGIAPILTFADTVLWNAKPADPQLPMSANNIDFWFTFSGTSTERSYHTVSAKAELRGVEILRIIEDYAHLPDVTDLHAVSKTARDLRRLVTVVQDLTDVTQNMKEGGVDPYTFYWEARPWFRGSDCGASKWIYDGVPESDSLDLGGPSGGQSTVMHAIDVFLDVDHKLQQKRSPAPSEENKKADKGFMERMRRYMPGSHQVYLKDLAALPVSIRSLAKTSPVLRESYDLAILALKRFRDMHMRMACLYTISMAHTTPPGTPEEVLERNRTQSRGSTKGTGGSSVASLLKAGRDATDRSRLSRR